MIVTGVILYASDTFPLRMVWLSTLAWMFGGGFAVASTMVWTMMADVTAESQRFVFATLNKYREIMSLTYRFTIGLLFSSSSASQ